MRAFIAALILSLGIFATAEENASEETMHSASSAFELMKTFDGTWTGEMARVPVGTSREDVPARSTTVTFETIANGSSVVAVFAVDTPMEMMSLFHQDGPDRMIHTHYCAIGNQPTMAFVPSSEADTIEFEFTGGTNMDVETDPHVHDATFHYVDANTITAEIRTWNKGQHAATQFWTLSRSE